MKGLSEFERKCWWGGFWTGATVVALIVITLWLVLGEFGS